MERGPVLQPRLRAIADLLPEADVLADIGTDHGYIPAALLLEGRIRRAIATDIGQAPLDHARRTMQKFGLLEQVDLRLGSGLAVVAPGEADVVVIAGMGGDNIASILSAAPWTRGGPLLLLQPMSRAEVLRAFLPKNGYEVQAERLAADKGVLYPILAVRGGAMAQASPAQAWGGFLLWEDPLWGRYLEERILRLRKAATGLALARDSAQARRREDLLGVVAELDIWRREWQDVNRTRC